MSSLRDRLAQLSPEQRALLARRLEAHGRDKTPPSATEQSRAGACSLGIDGTDARAVPEEGPVPEGGGPGRRWQLLPLSARSDQDLAQVATRLADHLAANPEEELADVACTLASRRPAFGRRRAVVCLDAADAVLRLRQVAQAGEIRSAGRAAKVAFLFPGQGTQYPGMARGLYADEPVFRAELDSCLELFAPHLGEDLRASLFPAEVAATGADQRLEQTALAQPALFAVEYALARTLESRGIVPHAMAGHSIGEYVAACLAGVFSLADATALVAARGRLMQATPRGAMLAVFQPEAEVAALLDERFGLAAVNAPSLCVVSGPVEAVTELEQRLDAAGAGCRRLHTSHAFHSPLVAPAVQPFLAELRQIGLHAPRIPFCSNVTGTWIEDAQATDPGYWGTHLRGTVRFADNLSALLADPDLLLIEVGPGRSLANMAREHGAWTPDRVVAGTLRRPGERRPDRQVLLEGLGALWAAGTDADCAACHGAERRRTVRLPEHPATPVAPAEPGLVPGAEQPHGHVLSDYWFWARRPRPAAAIRLVCLPYAGGGASEYRGWDHLAPHHVEVCPVELPGHGIRMGEAPFIRLQPLVGALADALEPLLDRPCAFFGHSMGGLVAFELARLLRRRGWPEPCHLFISAAPAPTRCHEPAMHDVPDAEMRARLKTLNGTPRAILEDDELMTLALPVIRADFSVLETYEYYEEPPLDVPITVFGGLHDSAVPPSDLEGWRAHSTHSSLRLLPGDHFFIHELAPELVHLVTGHFAQACAETGPGGLIFH